MLQYEINEHHLTQDGVIDVSVIDNENHKAGLVDKSFLSSKMHHRANQDEKRMWTKN